MMDNGRVMSTELKEIVRKYALQNAALYGGKANPKAVMGKVLAEQPEYRSRAKEVAAVADEVCREDRKPSIRRDNQNGGKDRPFSSKKVKEERKHILPELPGAEEGNVVMRMAPGPSGPLHLGHTRVSILNDEYVKRYKGTYIDRLEDTNPEKIDPDAYKIDP